MPILILPLWEKVAVPVCMTYFVVCVLTYWIVKLRLRDTRVLEETWRDQVLDDTKSRVSVGVILSILEHLHIIFVFGGVLLFSVNALYWIEPKKSWLDALFMACMAFNLKGFDDFQIPETMAARIVCALLSILSVLFVGFLAAAFLKPFVIVFKHK